MPVDITASQVVTLTIDVDTDGIADPGDTMTFTTTIKNIGDTDATGTQFAQVLDGVTLVPGSINVSPIAFDDSYDAAGNAQVSIPAGSGVMANDVDFLADTFSVTGFDATSANGGKVTVNADGSFSYTSATGFTGTDSFNYTVTDSKGLTSTATVNLDVGPSVWFIDDNASPGGDGSQGSPFNSLAAFNAANAAGGGNQPQTGDVIFLRAGTYTEADGINLKDGQTLVGQGQNLVVNGVTIETGSAGQTPTIVVTGGSANDNAIGLAQNNSISGLDINVQNGAADGIEDGGGTVGNLTISDVSISGAGQAIDIDQGGALNVTLDSVTSTGSSEEGIQLAGTSGSLTATTVSLSGSAGDAVDINGHTGTAAINGGSIAAGNANSIAVDIAGGAGNVSIAAGITDTNSNDIVEISGRTGGTVTLSGNITASGGTSNGIDVSGNSGGTVNFTGAVSLTTGANTAVNLSSNTGSTVNFNSSGNGLDISTTSGSGFSAAGGGSVTVTGAGNTISSGTGTALSITNTTIGANDVTFQSISASGGTATGIILDNAGSLGGLHVTGNGANVGATGGGVIANRTGADGSTTTGVGIYLNNTSDVQLNGMQLNDFSNYAIRGQNVNGFSLDHSNISGTNGNNVGIDEGAVIFGVRAGTTGLTGTASITNTTISGGAEDNIGIYNTNGTLNLTVDNISSNNAGNGGLVTEQHTGGTINIAVNNSDFTNNKGPNFFAAANDAANVHVKFGNTGGNTMTNTLGDAIVGGTVGVQTGLGWSGSGSANFSNNTITGAQDTPLNINIGGTGTFNALVNANTIGTSGVAESGTDDNEDAIRIVANGDGATDSTPNGGTLTVAVTNNTIQQVAGRGIFVFARDGGTASDPIELNATITGNILRQSPSSGGQGIRVEAGATSADFVKIHADIGGAGALANVFQDDWGTNLPAGVDFDEIRLFDGAGSAQFILTNLGADTSTSAIATYLAGRNTLGVGGVASAAGGSPNYSSGGSPSQPVLPLLADPTSPNQGEDSPDRPVVPVLPPLDESTDPTPPEQPTVAVDGDHIVNAAELGLLLEAATARWAAAGLDASQIAA